MISQKRQRFGFLVLGLWLVLSGPALALDKPGFLNPDYVSKALQGDLSDMGDTLETLTDSDQNRELLAHFRARFIDRTDGLDLANEDPLVKKVGDRFQDYWRDALLSPGRRDDLEDDLGRDLVKILASEGAGGWGLTTRNYQEKLSAILKQRGYEGIFGRTPPLLEFMVWKTDRTERIPVELTDGKYETTVHFLDDFISYGWSYFATFGGPSTGGWADGEGLYIVSPKWDLETEAFSISFLKHETRHFADYKLFPRLGAADLEYRAKLTELAFALEDTYSLLENFTNHAAKVENAPHPLANWYVISDLSKALLGTDWPENPEVWETLSIEDIQTAARVLLDKNTKTLKAKGARTTSGIIRP